MDSADSCFAARYSLPANVENEKRRVFFRRQNRMKRDAALCLLVRKRGEAGEKYLSVLVRI